MNATEVGLGVLLLAASGAILSAANLPGSQVPFGIAGVAAVGLVAGLVLADRRQRERA